MSYCTKCGTYNTDEARYCYKCGTPLVQIKESVESDAQAVIENVESDTQATAENVDFSQATYTEPKTVVAPETPDVNSHLFLSVFAIFMCLIPGIIALVYSIKSRKAVELDSKKSNANIAKTWAIVAIVLGCMVVFGNLHNRGVI